MNVEVLPLNINAVRPVRVLASFWQRVVAFVIDLIVVTLPCFIIGSAFFDFFSRSSAWGILIGLVITLPYFAVLGSSIGGGQTLGHRYAHIRVVDKEGSPLSVKRSAIRYLILLAPFTITSAVLPASMPSASRTYFEWLLLGAPQVAIFYLYIFNVRTRQSLHDIVTKAFVVDAPLSGRVDVPSFWPGHWAILGSAAVCATLIAASVGTRISQSEFFSELTSIQQAILQSGRVQAVGVNLQKNWTNGQTTTGIVVNVSWKGNPPDYEKAAGEIAAIVFKAAPRAAERDFVAVYFNNGFRVGLATFDKEQAVSYSPKRWMELLQQPGAKP